MAARIARHVRRHGYGIVAIFIALGGSAYAAATIGSKDIKPDAVRSKHVKDGQIKSPDIDPAALQGLDAASLDGAILISDQESAGAGQGGPQIIGQIPGVGHFEATCLANSVSVKFRSEFGGGNLAVIQELNDFDGALYEEIGNGAATSDLGTGGADATAALITYRIHRGQQAAPEVETPKATVTVTLRRGTDTIPDLCNYTVQGIAQP
jgi:hypothetical protein